MAIFDGRKQFFVAIDKDTPESKPGSLIAIYYADWESRRAVIEGWRGPKMESEDFARTRLEPYRCMNLLVDIGGFFECVSGTVI